MKAGDTGNITGSAKLWLGARPFFCGEAARGGGTGGPNWDAETRRHGRPRAGGTGPIYWREHPRLTTYEWPKEPGEGATRFKGDRLCLPGLTRDVDGREEDGGGWHTRPPAAQAQLIPLQTGAELHS